MVKKIYFNISGRVQGIGFRWFVQDTARKYNLSGWVRNVENGNVEGKIKGENSDIETFLSEIKTNHPIAIVKKIEIKEIQEDINESGFYIKH